MVEVFTSGKLGKSALGGATAVALAVGVVTLAPAQAAEGQLHASSDTATVSLHSEGYLEDAAIGGVPVAKPTTGHGAELREDTGPPGTSQSSDRRAGTELRNGVNAAETVVVEPVIATTPFAAPLAIPLVWKVAAAAIGALAAGAVIYTAVYRNPQERRDLINHCYEIGGYPVLDSRDSASVDISGDGASFEVGTEMNFECKKG